MEPIRTTTQKLLNSWSSARQKDAILKQGIKRLLTAQERRHIKHYTLKQAHIVLDVDSSSWLYLFNLKKERLLKSINQILGPRQAITGIRLRLNRDEAKTQNTIQNKG